MEQTDEKARERKPKICKLAILSPLVVILGFLLGVVLLNRRQMRDFGAYIFMLSPIVGLLLGIISSWMIVKSRRTLKGYVFSISGVISFLAVVVFIILMPWLEPSWIPAGKVVYASSLSGLGKAIKIYAYENDGRYPEPNKWCDLLIEHADVTEGYYVCRDALKRGDKGRCHCAINPNCGPNSPPDTVLLFETKGGWNQHGGPELLTTEHSDGIGCNIVFNDTHVRFIRKEGLSELKWGNKPE